MKVRIRFLKDFNDKKKGDEFMMDKAGAEMYLKEDSTILEIIDSEKEERLKQIEVIKAENLLDRLPQLNGDDLKKLGYKPEAVDKAEIKIKEKKQKKIINLNSFDLTSYLSLKKDKDWGGASEMIVKYILKKYKVYTTRVDEKPEVYIYQEGIYTPNGRSFIKEIMRKELLKEFYSTWDYNQVIAKIETDTFIDYDTFFKTNYKEEIPVLNGILNIKTRTLSDFTPDKIFFNKCPINYNPEAICQNIKKFLSDVLSCEDDIMVFYEMGGCCLYKEYTFEKAFMLVGGGRNGKGKSIELIKRVIGPENCYGMPLSALNYDNADLWKLWNSMVNLAGDIGNRDLKDTSLFKSLTARDFVTARRKYLPALTFENYAKFIFACNELPMVYDTSKGFWERWVLLEFPYYFADKEEYERCKNIAENKNWKLRDEEIINRIATQEELSGLLNKFLDGFDRLFKQRRFSCTKGSEEIKNTWIRKANSFMAFCMDNLEEDYEGMISKQEVRRRYSKYCKLHRLKNKSEVVMKVVLQEQFGADDERIGPMENREWYWRGIKWKQ
jgi:P4 family phage/plasmid primase-like protien